MIVADEFTLSRDMYRKIKQSDRRHLEAFLKSMYTRGVEQGFNSAQQKRNIPFDRKELSIILLDEIKGISVDKAEKIINVLADKYELRQQAEQ